VNATYTKLRDGSWGIRVTGTAKAGDVVTVTKRSGETVNATVGRVVWSGNGVSLCEVAAAPKRGRRAAAKPRVQRGPDVRIEYPCQGQTYSKDEHGVYVYDTFPASSVLAGQQRRAFKTSGTLEHCQAFCQEHYGSVPGHVSGCGHVPAYVAHLPTGQDY
jgi:hypothetical protein